MNALSPAAQAALTEFQACKSWEQRARLLLQWGNQLEQLPQAQCTPETLLLESFECCALALVSESSSSVPEFASTIQTSLVPKELSTPYKKAIFDPDGEKFGTPSRYPAIDVIACTSPVTSSILLIKAVVIGLSS